MSQLVDIAGLNIRFTGGRTVYAVNDLWLSLGKSEVLGLLGESGSGKSVTLRALMRLLPKKRTQIAGCSPLPLLAPSAARGSRLSRAPRPRSTRRRTIAVLRRAAALPKRAAAWPCRPMSGSGLTAWRAASWLNARRLLPRRNGQRTNRARSAFLVVTSVGSG